MLDSNGDYSLPRMIPRPASAGLLSFLPVENRTRRFERTASFIDKRGKNGYHTKKWHGRNSRDLFAAKRALSTERVRHGRGADQLSGRPHGSAL